MTEQSSYDAVKTKPVWISWLAIGSVLLGAAWVVWLLTQPPKHSVAEVRWVKHEQNDSDLSEIRQPSPELVVSSGSHEGVLELIETWDAPESSATMEETGRLLRLGPLEDRTEPTVPESQEAATRPLQTVSLEARDTHPMSRYARIASKLADVADALDRLDDRLVGSETSAVE